MRNPAQDGNNNTRIIPLTKEEIAQIGWLWKREEDISYLETVMEFRDLLPYFRSLADNDVIEIGP